MDKNKNIILSGIIVAIVVLVSTSFALLLNHGQTNDLRKVEVRLKWQPLWHVAAGEIAAQKLGYYKQEGLDVKLLPGGSDFPSIKSVASGETPLGVAGGDEVVLAVSEGLPVKAIAVIMKSNPITWFSRNNQPINTPKDFEGKIVGIKPGTNVYDMYEIILKDYNIDRTKIKEVPVKFDLTPFIDGRVDIWPGYLVNEPLVAESKGIDIVEMDAKDLGYNTYFGNVIIVNTKFLKEHPDVVKRYLKATIKGWEYALNHNEETARWIVNESGNAFSLESQIADAKADSKLLTDFGKNLDIGAMKREKWNMLVKILKREGKVKTVKLNQIYTCDILWGVYKNESVCN